MAGGLGSLARLARSLGDTGDVGLVDPACRPREWAELSKSQLGSLSAHDEHPIRDHLDNETRARTTVDRKKAERRQETHGWKRNTRTAQDFPGVITTPSEPGMVVHPSACIVNMCQRGR
jgi:hypothetical protein